MPNPKRRHSKTRGRKRRTHDALRGDDCRQLPAVRRAEGAAHRLQVLRVLQANARSGGRRRVADQVIRDQGSRIRH